jgi:hypothetical protein
MLICFDRRKKQNNYSSDYIFVCRINKTRPINNNYLKDCSFQRKNKNNIGKFPCFVKVFVVLEYVFVKHLTIIARE